MLGYMCMGVHVCVDVQEYVCVCVWRPETDKDILKALCSYLNQALRELAHLGSHLALGIHNTSLECWDYRCSTHPPGIYMDAEDLRSAEPPPQP